MNIKCTLESEGYRLLFSFENIDNLREGVDFSAEFILDSSNYGLSVKSSTTFINFNDLQRLITYFEEHITSLKKNPNSESDTFVTYGLKFQIKALSGEVSDEMIGGGYFSIQCMVNAGTILNKAGNTYVGGESIITIENTYSFISSLNKAIATLSN